MLFRQFVLVFIAALFWGCSGGASTITSPSPAPVVTQPPAPVTVMSSSLSGPQSARIATGFQLNWVETLSDTTTRVAREGITWTTSEAFAEVDQTGKVEIKQNFGPSTFQVVATRGAERLTHTVKVEANPDIQPYSLRWVVEPQQELPPGSIGGQVALSVNATTGIRSVKLVPTVWGSNGVKAPAPGKIEWHASNRSDGNSPLPVAVNRDGMATAQRRGLSEIRAEIPTEKWGYQMATILIEAQ